MVGTSLLIIGGAQGSASVLSNWLSSKPAQKIGDWSYSLYLWHWPFVVFGGLLWPTNPWAPAIAAGLSFAPAILSFYLLEQPLRQKQLTSSRQVVRVITGTLAPPALVLSASGLVSAVLITPFISERVGNPVEVSPAVDANCLSDDADYSAEWAERCTWYPEHSGDPIYLVGDSNAAHFDESILATARELERPATIITADSCVPVNEFDVLNTDLRSMHEWCPTYERFLEDYLGSARPGTVVIAFSDLDAWYTDRAYIWRGSEPVRDREEKAQLLERALLEKIDQLTKQGHRVLLVQAVPQFRVPGPGFEPQDCNLFELVEGRCTAEVSLADLEPVQGINWEVFRRVANTTDSALLDLSDQWCSQGVCSATRGTYIAYRDDIHISASEARIIAPRFLEAMP